MENTTVDLISKFGVGGLLLYILMRFYTDVQSGLVARIKWQEDALTKYQDMAIEVTKATALLKLETVSKWTKTPGSLPGGEG